MHHLYKDQTWNLRFSVSSRENFKNDKDFPVWNDVFSESCYFCLHQIHKPVGFQFCFDWKQSAVHLIYPIQLMFNYFYIIDGTFK